MKHIASEGEGVIAYMQQEGRFFPALFDDNGARAWCCVLLWTR
jgi:hypothetical protein